jgi:glutathione-independent formaldehyde dehydrogenase
MEPKVGLAAMNQKPLQEMLRGLQREEKLDGVDKGTDAVGFQAHDRDHPDRERPTRSSPTPPAWSTPPARSRSPGSTPNTTWTPSPAGVPTGT